MHRVKCWWNIRRPPKPLMKCRRPHNRCHSPARCPQTKTCFCMASILNNTATPLTLRATITARGCGVTPPMRALTMPMGCCCCAAGSLQTQSPILRRQFASLPARAPTPTTVNPFITLVFVKNCWASRKKHTTAFTKRLGAVRGKMRPFTRWRVLKRQTASRRRPLPM
ncbi:hypothetical protein SDC9_115370 [bioreactor metagenome]|uniref:Uncharacterized protein n=1 Tax=bioreactor metagenome TaxID=1076179 RepID=A0A645BTN6_9ZZZZ